MQGQRVEAELLTLGPMLQVEYAEAKVQWLQELHERECAELEEMLAREYQERVLQEHEKVRWEMQCLICIDTEGGERKLSHSAAGACQYVRSAICCRTATGTLKGGERKVAFMKWETHCFIWQAEGRGRNVSAAVA